MKKPMAGVGLVVICVMFSGLVAGCGERPQSHPVTIMADRYVPRMGLIEFVVKDPAREQRVTEIYGELEQLTFEWQGRRAHYLGELFDLSESDHEPTEEELEALFSAGYDETVVFFDRYVDIQMAMRENLNADEFARLDGIR